ncbi:hypothetical protein FRC19_011595 [Serendipita sp. 401]|nr:hypothetical protein FRC19_011595 [Serendipita sp. 401]
MKPKSFGAEANSSGDDSDELDKLLRDSVKKKHGVQVKKPQASQDGFSDTEMEDVMAAETESNQKITTLPWGDDDPWKFELDPNIFERGTGILAPLGIEKNRGIKDVEQQPLIDKGQNMSNQQEVRSSQENLLKELDDDALFEMLIKGIGTV